MFIGGHKQKSFFWCVCVFLCFFWGALGQHEVLLGNVNNLRGRCLVAYKIFFALFFMQMQVTLFPISYFSVILKYRSKELFEGLVLIWHLFIIFFAQLTIVTNLQGLGLVKAGVTKRWP